MEKLRLRTYNVAAMSFTPEEIATAIRRHMPNLTLTYNVCPIRQAIGKSRRKRCLLPIAI